MAHLVGGGDGVWGQTSGGWEGWEDEEMADHVFGWGMTDLFFFFGGGGDHVPGRGEGKIFCWGE